MPRSIAVWGSPGSGKSLFCCILAKTLARSQSRVALINADPVVPMLPIWIPGKELPPSASIGQIFAASSVAPSDVADRVTILESDPNIGLMGYGANENPLGYPVQYETLLRIFRTAALFADYIILDCSSNFANLFTPTAIETADVVVRILTPDHRGVQYLQSHQLILTDPCFRWNEHITLAGQARPFHDFEKAGKMAGGFDGLLPYSKEIDKCVSEGGAFQAISCCTSRYLASLSKVAGAL